jgi:hypothetical protein
VRDEESSWEALETSIAALGQAGHEGLATRLLRLTATVAKEAASRPSFAKALDVAMSPPTVGEESGGGPKGSDRASGRRAAPVLDPFVIHREAGPDSLRQSLGQHEVEDTRSADRPHHDNRQFTRAEGGCVPAVGTRPRQRVDVSARTTSAPG